MAPRNTHRPHTMKQRVTLVKGSGSITEISSCCDESDSEHKSSDNTPQRNVNNADLVRKGTFGHSCYVRGFSLTSITDGSSDGNSVLSSTLHSERSFTLRTLQDEASSCFNEPDRGTFFGHLIASQSSVSSLVCDDVNTMFTDQLNDWKFRLQQVQNKRFLSRQRKDHFVEIQFNNRVRAASDLASALNYLHSKRIIFRDIRPENIGFDFEGKVKLFNFNNHEKELIASEKVAIDQYKITKLDIPPRYQPPEVYHGRPYGFSADSYSYGLLLWQILSFKLPYQSHDDKSPEWAIIYEYQLRPKIDSSWPRHLKMLISGCWDEKPSYRLGFPMVCSIFERYFASRELAPAVG